jgi:hypothetical protein
MSKVPQSSHIQTRASAGVPPAQSPALPAPQLIARSMGPPDTPTTVGGGNFTGFDFLSRIASPVVSLPTGVDQGSENVRNYFLYP